MTIMNKALPWRRVHLSRSIAHGFTSTGVLPALQQCLPFVSVSSRTRHIKVRTKRDRQKMTNYEKTLPWQRVHLAGSIAHGFTSQACFQLCNGVSRLSPSPLEPDISRFEVSKTDKKIIKYEKALPWQRVHLSGSIALDCLSTGVFPASHRCLPFVSVSARTRDIKVRT
jgi:hypothetical protein